MAEMAFTFTNNSDMLSQSEITNNTYDVLNE